METNVRILGLLELEDIFKQFGDELLAYLISRHVRRDDALDILQNVFTKFVLINKKRGIRGENVRALLYRIAETSQIDFFRKEKCEEKYEGRNREEVLRQNFELISIDASSEILALIEIGLHDPLLSQRQREVLRLHFLGGLSGRKIASILNVSHHTVHRDLEKGRGVLRVYFKKEGLTPV